MAGGEKTDLLLRTDAKNGLWENFAAASEQNTYFYLTAAVGL